MIPSPLLTDRKPHLLSCGVEEVIVLLAGVCIVPLFHAAINSSFVLAENCSHFPPMPLQPSLHDNEDLKHKAGERYDM